MPTDILNVGESILDVGELTVGETTRRRNDWLPVGNFTPSLPVGHLETGGGGVSSHMKKSGMLVRKFEFNSYGRLGGRCLSFITPLKDTT